MTTPGIRIEGLDTLQKLFPTLQRQINSELKKGISASAIMVQNEAKDSMRKAKHGRTYRRGAAKGGRKRKNGTKTAVTAYKFHRASEPGEAPAVDSGRLIGSINHNITNDGLTALIGILDLTNVKYARAMEFGRPALVDKKGRHMPPIQPRPWLFPALEKQRDNIEKRIQLGIQKALSVNGGA